ncbi:AAA family ATPase [Azorhizobium doebereinerae]|uniref:AAA family ATPase n=1 Tax=Azorhizobium doebereinerae TaxID=281091 RepID=UPI0018DC6441|nr:AAA family ATPase [Azorhizobium doebereinerae]
MSAKKPADQMSPFERRLSNGGRVRKVQIEPGPRAEHIQGCGNPECAICMPKDGSGGEALFNEGDNMTLNGPNEEVIKILADEFFSRSSDRYGFTEALRIMNRASTPRDTKQQVRETERRLREKVKRFFLKTKHNVGWDDVVGNLDARRALQEAIEHPIKHQDLYAHYGMKLSKGVLLYGPPGCGKTMFGKAAASIVAELHGSADLEHTILSIKGPEIQSPYIGVTEDIIRNIFAYARAFKQLHGFPLVAFIDEADAIIPSRDDTSGRRALPWEESNVATFLTEMDGLDDSGAFVILATNRPDRIDAAVLRDGRCDRKIRVQRPDIEGVTAIAARQLAGAPLAFHMLPQTAASYLADSVFDTELKLFRIRHAGGPSFLHLGDIVSGAMVVGLVERAKTNAFQRDMASGGTPSGISLNDIKAAVLAVFAENKGLNQSYALDEFCTAHGIDEAVIEKFEPLMLSASGNAVKH